MAQPTTLAQDAPVQADAPAASAERSGVGDPALDLTAIVRSYQSKLFAYIDSIVNNRWVAEDLTQEVFLRLCSMRGLRHPAALTSWLYTVSRNVALDHLRRRRVERRAPPVLPEEPPTPLDVAEHREMFRLVRGAIERLGEPRRTIFLMCVMDGMDYASIGAATGCPEATVNSRMFRSWRRVRSSMQRYMRA